MGGRVAGRLGNQIDPNDIFNVVFRRSRRGTGAKSLRFKIRAVKVMKGDDLS